MANQATIRTVIETFAYSGLETKLKDYAWVHNFDIEVILVDQGFLRKKFRIVAKGDEEKIDEFMNYLRRLEANSGL